MIGSGLSKFAKENGMKVSGGVAYGSFRGYAATFSEGSGYKLLTFTSSKNDGQKFSALAQQLSAKEFYKQYRLKKAQAGGGRLDLEFHDTVGTMNKIKEFLDWFMPLMAQQGISGVNFCSECGMELGGGAGWKLIDGTAWHMHDTCAQRLLEKVRSEEDTYRLETRDSYAKGLVGAVLGGLVGAIPWAIVMYLGRVAAAIGLLIGWLADKGYRMFHGKNGKLKVLILILATVIGVVVGTMACDVARVAVMIAQGELPGFGYGDIITIFKDILFANEEYVSATLINMALGLFYALLGVFVFLYKAYRESKGFKMKNLD